MSRSPLRKALAQVRWRLRDTFYVTYGFRGTAPINAGYGSHLGTTIDRYYERHFLLEHGSHIRGRVLEVGDRKSSDLYGVDVKAVDVLNVEPGTGVDIVGDLASCPHVPSDTYNCVLLTQVLHVIFDMPSAIAEVHRILKPGGVTVCTLAGIAQVNRGALEDYGDRWRVTSLSAKELFGASFNAEDVHVTTYGNAHSACCFMQGIPAERLRPAKIDPCEPDYQLMVAVIARKSPQSR